MLDVLVYFINNKIQLKNKNKTKLIFQFKRLFLFFFNIKIIKTIVSTVYVVWCMVNGNTKKKNL